MNKIMILIALSMIPFSIAAPAPVPCDPGTIICIGLLVGAANCCRAGYNQPN